MKKKILKRTISVILALAVMFAMFPEGRFTAEAAGTNWVHLNDAEAAEAKATYDAENDRITFVNDWGWANRMKYIGVPDVSGKDYVVEFDLSVAGGLIGVYNYEDSGSMYGVYLDTNAAQLDALHFTDWTTCVDDFNFRESSTEGATVHPTTAAENWIGDVDKPESHLRVEFLCGEGGTLADGIVNYYKKDAVTGEYLLMGSVVTPETVTDNPEFANYFGIQLWIGDGSVSNITVQEYVPFKTAEWVHLNDAEKTEGKAVYNIDNDKITFVNDWGWANRMKYIGVPDVSGKDYVVEFDLSVAGGLIGVYNYEDSGSVYGVYLDTNAAQLDALHFTDWATCVDDFNFRESNTEGATVHPTTAAENWIGDVDKPESHLRVEFLCGEGGTLAGGVVNYYKKDVVTGKYLLMGSIVTPDTVTDNAEFTNYFGIQLWIGDGTVSNISVKEYESAWVHMSETEETEKKAVYNVYKDKITFVNDWGWANRMKYAGVSDVSGKDYAIEFDISAEGGLIGVYNYEDSGSMYGVYLDTNAAQLDVLHFTDWATCVDDFNFRESNTEGVEVHPNTTAMNWIGDLDKSGSHLRVEFIRGAAGALAGGTVNYYKKDMVTNEYLLLGSVVTPDTVTDNPELANHFGIQLWIGNGSVSNITVEEMEVKATLSVGGDDSITTAINVEVKNCEALPTGYVDGKYIAGWTVDGVKQLTYNSGIAADRYVADFIDTKMLDVKVQDNEATAGEGAEKLNARFIASVNNELQRYKSAGLVFSLSNSLPSVGGPNSTVRNTTTVYEALNVTDGETVSQVKTGALYDEYSQYLFACEITNIPVTNPAAKIYARAYVELMDGTIVYGAVRYVSVPDTTQ